MFFFGLIQPIYCEIKVTVTFHFPDRVKSLRVPKTAVIVDNHSFYHKTLKIFLLPSARPVNIPCFPWPLIPHHNKDLRRGSGLSKSLLHYRNQATSGRIIKC
jgi:hypothetical protein